MSFDLFCQDVARRFIKTVIVIDDLANLDGNEPRVEDIPAENLAVNLPPGRTFRPDAMQSAASENGKVPQATAIRESVSHALNGMQVTRGFARMGVACSIYKPEMVNQELEIEDTARVARHADIVVIDWKLGADETTAKEIIRRILEGDLQEGGRLRLIAIYTGESTLSDLMNQVAEEHSFLKPTDVEDSVGLCAPSLRIVFLNKNHPGVDDGPSRVEEADLAKRMVVEFAKLAKGVVPSVALGSITAIRLATHQLLSKFNSGLDGVFAGHRAMLKRPEDAEAFLVDLISEEIRSLLEISEVGRTHAGLDVLKNWVKDLKPNPADQFKSFPKMKEGLSTADVGRLLEQGVSSHAGLSQGFDPKPKTDILAENAASFFHIDPSATERANMEFARMSALRREAYGNTRFPQSWVPTLTLGTVVRRHGGQEEFFVCTQPLCDSVRIVGARRFPLIPLVRTSKFSIVIRLKDGSDLGVTPEFQPYKALHDHFEADPKTKSVRATARDGAFWFANQDTLEFEWIADLKGFFAQRVAQGSAGHADRVGLDMYEWLRLKDPT